MTTILQVRWNQGDPWTPAITGTLNQTGRTDDDASTFEDRVPEDVLQLVLEREPCECKIYEL